MSEGGVEKRRHRAPTTWSEWVELRSSLQKRACIPPGQPRPPPTTFGGGTPGSGWKGEGGPSGRGAAGATSRRSRRAPATPWTRTARRSTAGCASPVTAWGRCGGAREGGTGPEAGRGEDEDSEGVGGGLGPGRRKQAWDLGGQGRGRWGTLQERVSGKPTGARVVRGGAGRGPGVANAPLAAGGLLWCVTLSATLRLPVPAPGGRGGVSAGFTQGEGWRVEGVCRREPAAGPLCSESHAASATLEGPRPPIATPTSSRVGA